MRVYLQRLLKRSSMVDIDPDMIIERPPNTIRATVLNHLDRIADYTGTDVFLLEPKWSDPEVTGLTFSGGAETSLDQRYRVSIFGDTESVDHAKTRVLMMIDQIVILHQSSSLVLPKADSSYSSSTR
jgi:hypothetical protein